MKQSSIDRINRPHYKIYTRHHIGDKYEVLSWIQRKCKVCGRYIGGTKQFLCDRCYRKRHNDRYIRKEVQHYGMQTIRELSGISIPTYLRNSLRMYL